MSRRNKGLGDLKRTKDMWGVGAVSLLLELASPHLDMWLAWSQTSAVIWGFKQPRAGSHCQSHITDL